MTNKTRNASIICLSNHKGGVGKTATACNVGAGLARKGKKVLLIDLDPQANLTLSLGLKDTHKNIYRALMGDYPLSEATVNIYENFEIIPSHLDLSGAELELSAESGRELILRELLEEVRDKYDYILIDCAPSLGLLTLNAFTASQKVYIPLQAQYLAMQGLAKLTNVIELIKKRLNHSLEIEGVIITQYDDRKVLNREVANCIEEHFKEKVFKSRIRDTVAIAEAPSAGKDIFRYKPKSYGALDYEGVCDEILTRHK